MGNDVSQKTEARPVWKRVLRWVVKYCLPWGVTVWMVWWMCSKVNLGQVWDIVAHRCNFWWLALMMVFTVLSLVVRGFRWEMQLRQAGCEPAPPMVGPMAIFGAYALNLLFPRLGEAWRCLYISKRQKAPFMVVVGTDFGDRAADLMCVVVTIVLALWLCPWQMADFTSRYKLGADIRDVFSSPWLWGGLLVMVVGTKLLLHYGGSHKWVQSLARGLHNIWHGFVALFRIRPLGKFLWLTLGIWTCYYLQTYVSFFAFPFTQEMVSHSATGIGLLPGLLALVFGSCSTIIPSNGGLGPWTIAIAYSLQLFGVDMTDAMAYALTVWVMQAVTYIAMGICAAFYTRHTMANMTV